MAYVSEGTAKLAENLIRKNGGLVKTREAMELGIHPRTLYHLRDEGLLERVSRGVYRLTDLPGLSRPDLVVVAKRVPSAVVCLVSALAFHDITTEIPHHVHIALPRGRPTPRIEHPPLRVYRFARGSFESGIETHSFDGVQTRIYCAAKSVADCVKFRNRIGLDVAIEALNLALQRDKARPADLMRYARVCRVESLMGRYLEALI